jgi:hypothetical protein
MIDRCFTALSRDVKLLRPFNVGIASWCQLRESLESHEKYQSRRLVSLLRLEPAIYLETEMENTEVLHKRIGNFFL